MYMKVSIEENGILPNMHIDVFIYVSIEENGIDFQWRCLLTNWLTWIPKYTKWFAASGYLACIGLKRIKISGDRHHFFAVLSLRNQTDRMLLSFPVIMRFALCWCFTCSVVDMSCTKKLCYYWRSCASPLANYSLSANI